MSYLNSSTRRILLRTLILIAVLLGFSFMGVYLSGSSAYDSARQLGSMTTDYLRIQLDNFLDEYSGILMQGANYAEDMLSSDYPSDAIERWMTNFSSEYQAPSSTTKAVCTV